jgi:fructosamine-3-kinase
MAMYVDGFVLAVPEAKLADYRHGAGGRPGAGRRWALSPLAASSFCRTWRAEGAQPLFVKALPVAQAARLEAEADGLRALHATGTIAVPQVACCAPADGEQLLALEWLDFHPPDAGFGARLGQALGALHAATPAQGGGRFGWTRANYLGSTAQPNGWSDEPGLGGWMQFLREQRFGALMRRFIDAGGACSELSELVERVMDALPRFFDDGHLPRPSLIHGDLWSGNWSMRADGAPVVYDPAVSLSDAEAELAMMELFGSLPAGFWPAWQAVMGSHAGHARRRGLYQLYHLLNHALLFGGGYAAQAGCLARRLLR